MVCTDSRPFAKAVTAVAVADLVAVEVVTRGGFVVVGLGGWIVGGKVMRFRRMEWVEMTRTPGIVS